jgi:hypothetical protein
MIETEMQMLVMFVEDDSVFAMSFDQLAVFIFDEDLWIAQPFGVIMVSRGPDDKFDYFFDIIHS